MSRPAILAVGMAVVGVCAAAAQTQIRDRPANVAPTMAGTSTIRGRIVAAATGDPLRHAVVRLSGGSSSIGPTLSDEEGRFQFTALASGRFTVTATKPGFARSSAVVDFASRPTITVPDIALQRGGVISGFMVDAAGTPASGANVFLSRVAISNSGTEQRTVVGTTATDEAGAFRFGSLPADDYIVTSARLPGGGNLVVGPGEVYPSGRFRLATSPTIALEAGEERSNVTVLSPSDVPTLPPAPPGAPPPDAKRRIVIRGRITRADGTPLARAIVQLMPIVPGPPILAPSDESGHYEVVDPTTTVEAEYRIVARASGFIVGEYGSRPPRTRGAVLRLMPGDVREDIDIQLTRLSSVSGRILDDYGEPVEGAIVRAMQLRYEQGQRKLADTSGMVSRTDDLGRYRLIGLRQGQYALAATVGQVVVTESAAEFPGYGMTFFPGTANPTEIQLLSIGSAQELYDLDFRLVQQKTFRVAGHASDSAGDPATGGISLTPRRRSGSVVALQMGARISKDGGFEFLNVPPGEYVLQVLRGTGRNPFTEGEFAYRFIDIVDADVIDIDIQTGLGSTILGRLTFEGGEPPPLERLVLSAVSADPDRTPGGQLGRARFGEDGTFELDRINGPRRIEVTQAPTGWTMKSVIVNGIDMTDQALPFGREDQSLADVEVILTNQATRISGRIGETRDVVPTDLAALAFSTQREQWYVNSRYIRRSPVRSDGTFTFDGLPAGEYCMVAAYPPEDPGQWRDPEILDGLARHATRARLSPGQHISLDLGVR